MIPVLESIRKEYKDKLRVEFIDVKKNKDMAVKAEIKSIPTQIFYNSEGKEYFRHQGFFSEENIKKVIENKGNIISKKGPAEEIINNLNSNPLIAYIAVLLAGLLSSASPCVLAIIPLIIGFIGGYAEGDTKKAIYYSLVFVIGLTVSFTAIGATVGFVGGMLKILGNSGYIAISLIAIGAGLHLIEAIKIPLATPIQKIQPKQKGIIGGFLLGLIFGVASSPCATPVLIGVLALVSVKGQVLYGATLLLAYAAGHWALVLVAGISVSFVDRLAKAKGVNNFTAIMKKASGVIFILGGLYLFWKMI